MHARRPRANGAPTDANLGRAAHATAYCARGRPAQRRRIRGERSLRPMGAPPASYSNSDADGHAHHDASPSVAIPTTLSSGFEHTCTLRPRWFARPLWKQ